MKRAYYVLFCVMCFGPSLTYRTFKTHVPKILSPIRLTCEPCHVLYRHVLVTCHARAARPVGHLYVHGSTHSKGDF